MVERHTKQWRGALANIAKKIVEDLAPHESVDWVAVQKLVERFAEIFLSDPARPKPLEGEHLSFARDTARITTEMLRDEHIFGQLITGVALLVWRCYVYAIPASARGHGSTLRLGKKVISDLEENIFNGWKNSWKPFDDELMRDERGPKPKWNAPMLIAAINQAAPRVPGARWSHEAVAEKISQDMGLESPLTGEALRKLIDRHKVRQHWKAWEVIRKGEAGHKKPVFHVRVKRSKEKK